MFRLPGCIPLLLAALTCAPLAHAAPPSGVRSALLIGNAKYDGFELPGVTQSLDDVEKSLQAHGYAIDRHENLKEEELKQVVEEFAIGVPTGGVALVYYCGLAAHVDRLGKSYNLLRPVGAKVDSDSQYRDVGLQIEDGLLVPLRELSGSRHNLVFLDACWDSPIRPEHDNVHRGLKALEPGADTLVMFAAPSEKAIAPGENNSASPLAKALGKHLEAFDDSIAKACESIAKDVGGAWHDGAGEAGIGAPSDLPIREELGDGKVAGEGFVNSIGMTFRWCPPGEFAMGSDETDDPATRDRPPVQVELTRGFWMGQHEVTQREYYAVRRRTVASDFTAGKNIPFWGATEVKSVTEFCQGLTEIERKAGRLTDGWEYTCPSEAQWEYACRAGSQGRFCFGDAASQLGEHANFADAALKRENPDYHWAADDADDGVAEALAPVGSYRPNAWGLCDMHGNVAEIVADHLTAERPGGTDPLVQVEKDAVTQIRGGAWCSLPLYCESSFRNGLAGRDKLNYVGFRIVLIRK